MNTLESNLRQAETGRELTHERKECIYVAFHLKALFSLHCIEQLELKQKTAVLTDLRFQREEFEIMGMVRK